MSESWHDYGFGICTSNLKEEISLPGLMELISQAPELKERVNTFINNECGGAFKDSYDILTSYVEQYGILSSYPSDSANIYEVLMKGKKTYIAGLHLFFLLILITALFIFTVWLQDTEKKIPVTYSGKLQGKSTFKGVSTNTIPIKLCPGGVVPIIFASSLISFPILIAQIAGAKQNAVLKLLNSGYWFNTSKPWYTFGALIYLVLIFAFSYFYTEITMNPEEIANNIKKSGGNIAGIRAGSSTAEYLRKQMKYLIAIGSFCLCIIAIIPFIVSGLTGLSRLSFFGTSIIITVSVILETKKLILSKTQENYYMNRVKKGGLFRG